MKKCNRRELNTLRLRICDVLVWENPFGFCDWATAIKYVYAEENEKYKTANKAHRIEYERK